MAILRDVRCRRRRRLLISAVPGVAALFVACGTGSAPGAADATRTTATLSATPPTPTPTPTRTPTEQPTAAPPTATKHTRVTARPASTAPSTTLRRLTDLVASGGPGSTSVAALDVRTGRRVTAGARSGMYTASLVKLQFLESLLLVRQSRDSTGLSDAEVQTLRAMITQSDNGAAETAFWDVGGRPGVVGAERPLGLSTQLTVPGPEDFWGLTQSSAAEQLVLLRNLVESSSPLHQPSRRLALSLMGDVEADQAWGVSAAASPGTEPAVKNGWLDIDDDGGRWAVTSAGVLAVRGHPVLVAVMTQHNSSYEDGVRRVEALARAAVAAVR